MQMRKLHKIERNGHVCTLKLGPSETRIHSWPMPGRVVRPRSRHLVGSERAAQSRIRTAKAQPTQQHNTFYSISCLQNNKIKLSWDGADLAPQTRACPYCRSPAAVKPMHNYSLPYSFYTKSNKTTCFCSIFTAMHQLIWFIRLPPKLEFRRRHHIIAAYVSYSTLKITK